MKNMSGDFDDNSLRGFYVLIKKVCYRLSCQFDDYKMSSKLFFFPQNKIKTDYLRPHASFLFSCEISLTRSKHYFPH